MKSLLRAFPILFLLAAPTLIAQQSKSTRTAAGYPIPSDLLGPFAALGERAYLTEKGRMVLVGDLSDPSDKKETLRVVQESPRLRVEHDKGDTLEFDGERTSGLGLKSVADEDLVESLLSDTADGLVASIGRGASLRLLGRGFRPDPKLFPEYHGPSYDVYELTGEVLGFAQQVIRTKLYYFDLSTGLLLSTRYQDSARHEIETRVSGWANIAGSAIPGRIERYVDGHRVFAFDVLERSVESRQSAPEKPKAIGRNK